MWPEWWIWLVWEVTPFYKHLVVRIGFTDKLDVGRKQTMPSDFFDPSSWRYREGVWGGTNRGGADVGGRGFLLGSRSSAWGPVKLPRPPRHPSGNIRWVVGPTSLDFQHLWACHYSFTFLWLLFHSNLIEMWFIYHQFTLLKENLQSDRFEYFTELHIDCAIVTIVQFYTVFITY